ncbi:hypothetical protein B0H17DRAFT_1129822 [Mycena rosella]|uniref:Uncharacterized protein n=1 Tax=Mycena rosella TaxID=1033263 RepID=A0AAD7DRU9_MYCRO|nr:hypothetical protein B0H17DRAFT_1129822 [Mycena rosella]
MPQLVKNIVLSSEDEDNSEGLGSTPNTPTRINAPLPSLSNYFHGVVEIHASTSAARPFSTPIARQLVEESLPGSSPIPSSPVTPIPSPVRMAATRALANTAPSELPPLSSDGIIPSSPVIGTREEKVAATRRKNQCKRALTLATHKVVSKQATEENKTAIFDEILEKLPANGLTFGQLMLDTARGEIGSWAENYVAALIQSEGQDVTASKALQTTDMAVDNSYVTGFSMVRAGEMLGSVARVATKMLNAFATSAHNLKTNLPLRAGKRFTVVISAALALLGEFSHENNYSQRIMGLYLYATGAQRQTITVMSHLGISESYQNLTHKPRTNIHRCTRRICGDHDPPAPPPSTLPDRPTEPYTQWKGSYASS